MQWMFDFFTQPSVIQVEGPAWAVGLGLAVVTLSAMFFGKAIL